MATSARMAKMVRPLKYAIRVRHRCRKCGRPRAYYRKFDLCRLCFRELALKGEIPGVTKSSW
ncbi:MAG TPA: type Z 30S ribosomal protein S14 [Acidobacteriota bacterium]|nr:type Z 30S ribosomal protein S14 [Acidobacteriota bacterium]